MDGSNSCFCSSINLQSTSPGMLSKKKKPEFVIVNAHNTSTHGDARCNSHDEKPPSGFCLNILWFMSQEIMRLQMYLLNINKGKENGTTAEKKDLQRHNYINCLIFNVHVHQI